MLNSQDSQGFAVNTLVKVDYEPHPLFFRILALDHAHNQLQVPPSRTPDPELCTLARPQLQTHAQQVGCTDLASGILRCVTHSC